MTERYGYGYGDEPRDQRPSGRGAVTERQEREDRGDQEVREIDLTDTAQEQAAAEEEAEDEQARAQREAADAFEPAAASEADEEQQEEQEEDVRPGGGPSIFDVGQRDSADETERPTGYEPAAAAAEAAPAPPAATLLASLDAADIRSRFLDIQAGFVDEPRQAVEEAGRFVEELVQQVIGALQAQRGQLHGVLAEGSTEDLRLALRGYRQFVDRLLGLAL
jgi:hypothetical protein